MSGILTHPYDPRIDHLLDRDFLVTVFPDWYPQYLARIEVERQQIRDRGLGGTYNSKALGFSPGKRMRVCYEMPTVIKAWLDRVDKTILADPKKRDVFLKKHPEYDLRVRGV